MIRNAYLALTASILIAAAPSAIAADPRDSAGAIRPDLCSDGYFQSHPARFVDFMGFFPTRGVAESAAALIDEGRFVVEVRSAATGDSWSLMARYRQLPEQSQFLLDKSEMSAIGERFGSVALTPGCVSHYESR